MLRNLTALVVALVVATGSRAVAALDDHPPVFDTRAYAEAKKAAEEGKKWFIVKGTAEWCGPCKQMDKTAWVDEKVTGWFKEKGIAVAVDVDKEPGLARSLEINAMPTMIAFKDGKEFDRIVGSRGAPQFMAWLEGLEKGERSPEALQRDRLKKRAEGGKLTVAERLEAAQDLVQQKKGVRAADEYVWLWENMAKEEPATAGARLTSMTDEMAKLAEKNKEAWGKFAALRDKVGKALEGEKVEPESVLDWVVLNNRVLDEREATVKWYERVKEDAKWKPVVDRVRGELVKMFVEMDRWGDAGKLVGDPMAEIEREAGVLKAASEAKAEPGEDDSRGTAVTAAKKRFREAAGQLYASLLAAKRDEDAAKVGARAREADGNVVMTRMLIETALKAGQARKAQLGWLEEAEQAGNPVSDLEERVKEGLGGR